MTRSVDVDRGLSHVRLLEALRYDPVTGLWTCRIAIAFRKPGDQMGELKSSGYVLVGLDGFRYRSHRLAWFYMTGAWPDDQVDHRDGDRSNNRWSNLRAATNTQNQANSKLSKNNRCGFKGVYAYGDRWRAKLNVGRRQVHIGTFDTPQEANSAYAAAARQHFGEFARAA